MLWCELTFRRNLRDEELTIISAVPLAENAAILPRENGGVPPCTHFADESGREWCTGVAIKPWRATIADRRLLSPEVVALEVGSRIGVRELHNTQCEM